MCYGTRAWGYSLFTIAGTPMLRFSDESTMEVVDSMASKLEAARCSLSLSLSIYLSLPRPPLFLSLLLVSIRVCMYCVCVCCVYVQLLQRQLYRVASAGVMDTHVFCPIGIDLIDLYHAGKHPYSPSAPPSLPALCSRCPPPRSCTRGLASPAGTGTPGLATLTHLTHLHLFLIRCSCACSTAVWRYQVHQNLILILILILILHHKPSKAQCCC